MIKQAFLEQVTNLTQNKPLAESFWLEIETAYTAPDRHFHNLAHLEHLFKELKPLQGQIDDWETLFFSLCYHDVVYDVAQNAVLNDNEERSAAFAQRHLEQIAYPVEKIEACREQIMATKKHDFSNDNDTNWLTDADLSILGQPWELYDEYRNNIRQEFQVYPAFIYNAGRRKVLEYFVNLKPLYKTPHFYHLYEERAKENISTELQLLRE